MSFGKTTHQRAVGTLCIRASSWQSCSICRFQTCVINMLGKYTLVLLSIKKKPNTRALLADVLTWKSQPGLHNVSS